MLVSEDEAFRRAGADAEVVDAGDVTYARGRDALVIIVAAGERPDGSQLASREDVTLRRPFPGPVTDWLGDHRRPWLGFVRLSDGCLPLGRLREVCRYGGGTDLIDNGYFPRDPAADTGLQGIDLALEKRLPSRALDLARPAGDEPVPGVGWLLDVQHDRVAALREFLTGWYADVPEQEPDGIEPSMELPEPLRVFYELAARKPIIYGTQDTVRRPEELEYDDDFDGVPFADENQGVWTRVINFDLDDPPVYDDGEPDAEPLSGFLLQFALIEAVMSAPYAGQAELTEAERDRFVEGLIPVPLAPARFPVDPTRIYVAPGLIALTFPSDEAFGLTVAGRRRSALREVREPGFAWANFTG
ncbi:hypothetical protein GCM10010168_25640 [Actinoplanes ianthinogenes]|uniref:Suppressor of fused-like domain-containing protein n=1 Tax=Actinoplanes ianthinogenes TaxID=122358 RepID=A0ABN6CWK1_9ACTN|nr:hypothetical protein [Actinoplanes ianthinogenes]BCJ48204.1 hypothetical protein Aiant_88610 [Actinoplanes ianthinogenes]GGR07126.1 hypothetical protein GCM10010168_25640 [Actinoplanes ianthinogenes]